METIELFYNLSQDLSRIGSDLNASELHGMLTGIFIGNTHAAYSWQDIFSKNAQEVLEDGELKQKICKLNDKLESSFKELDFEFELLLPGDEEDLAYRTNCLSLWSSGFLSGLGLVGFTVHGTTDLVKELLEDIANIANAFAEGEDLEEEETAFINLIEYLKVGVQNLHIELHAQNLTSDSVH